MADPLNDLTETNAITVPVAAVRRSLDASGCHALRRANSPSARPLPAPERDDCPAPRRSMDAESLCPITMLTRRELGHDAYESLGDDGRLYSKDGLARWLQILGQRRQNHALPRYHSPLTFRDLSVDAHALGVVPSPPAANNTRARALPAGTTHAAASLASCIATVGGGIALPVVACTRLLNSNSASGIVFLGTLLAVPGGVLMGAATGFVLSASITKVLHPFEGRPAAPAPIA